MGWEGNGNGEGEGEGGRRGAEVGGWESEWDEGDEWMEGFSVRMGKEGATRIAFGGYLVCFCLGAEPVLCPRTHGIVSTASCDALSRIRAYDPLKSVCQSWWTRKKAVLAPTKRKYMSKIQSKVVEHFFLLTA